MTSSEEDSRAESQSNPLEYSEQGEEAVRDLHEEIANIFEMTLSRIKSLSFTKETKIGGSNPETPRRRYYSSEGDQSPTDRGPTRSNMYGTFQPHNTFRVLHKTLQTKTMAHTPEKQKLPKFMGDGLKDSV